MDIEFNGELIEICDGETLGIDPPPVAIHPRVPDVHGIGIGATFISEFLMEIGDIFTEPKSGVKYKVIDQQGSMYWARPV